MATGDIKGVKENALGTFDEILLNDEFATIADLGDIQTILESL